MYPIACHSTCQLIGSCHDAEGTGVGGGGGPLDIMQTGPGIVRMSGNFIHFISTLYLLHIDSVVDMKLLMSLVCNEWQTL